MVYLALIMVSLYVHCSTSHIYSLCVVELLLQVLLILLQAVEQGGDAVLLRQAGLEAPHGPLHHVGQAPRQEVRVAGVEGLAAGRHARQVLEQGADAHIVAALSLTTALAVAATSGADTTRSNCSASIRVGVVVAASAAQLGDGQQV